MYYILQNASILVNTIGATPLAALLEPKTTLLPVLEFIYEEKYSDVVNNPKEKAVVTWNLAANVFLLKQTNHVLTHVEVALKKSEKPIVLDHTTYGESLIGPITTFRDLLTTDAVSQEVSIFDSKGYEASVAKKKEEVREKFDIRVREWVLRWYELHEEIVAEEIEAESRKATAVDTPILDPDADLTDDEPVNELIAEAKINESTNILYELYGERDRLKEKLLKFYEGLGTGYFETTPLITWTAIVEGIKKNKSSLVNAGIVNYIIEKYGEEAFHYIHESVLDQLTEFLFHVEKSASIETSVEYSRVGEE